MMPKFIRVTGDIINVNDILRVYLEENKTYITSKNGSDNTTYMYYEGDYRDDIWELMKLALKPPIKLQEQLKKKDEVVVL